MQYEKEASCDFKCKLKNSCQLEMINDPHVIANTCPAVAKNKNKFHLQKHIFSVDSKPPLFKMIKRKDKQLQPDDKTAKSTRHHQKWRCKNFTQQQRHVFSPRWLSSKADCRHRKRLAASQRTAAISLDADPGLRNLLTFLRVVSERTVHQHAREGRPRPKSFIFYYRTLLTREKAGKTKQSL